MKTRSGKPLDKKQIEGLVRDRKTVTAQSAIQRWLRSRPDLDSKIQACDWWRRLGDLNRAYRIVAPKEFKLKKASLSVSEIKQYLWCARILNLMGASHYALQIVHQISIARARSQGADECRVLGNIFLSNCDFKNAYDCFMAAEEVEQNPAAYAARLGRIGLCDALAGLAKYDRALRELKKIEARSDEKLLQGIILQAEGEYLARNRNYKAALEVCERAIQYFSKDDPSPDYAFMLKWIGIAKIASGSKTEGVDLLNQSLRALKKPSRRPEMWIDCIYWKEVMGVASPEERETLRRYPGQPDFYLSRYSQIPTEDESKGKSLIRIYPRRGEWSWKAEVKSYIPKEIELASWIKLSHPHGLPLYRAFTLLWPDEINSFLQLEDRIHQLLKRLREVYALQVSVDDKNLFLAETSAREIMVNSEAATPLVFSQSLRVRRSDIAEFYRLGSTQVHHLIRRWIDGGSVRALKQGRETWIEWRK